jgi:hypothetical protein
VPHPHLDLWHSSTIPNELRIRGLGSVSSHGAPAAYIKNENGESGEDFEAKMYVMWDPALSSGCGIKIKHLDLEFERVDEKSIYCLV